MLPETPGGLNVSLIKFVKLMKAFEKIGLATDTYLGHLTVSPAKLGTAFSLECKIPGKQLPVSTEKAKNIEQQYGVTISHSGKFTLLQTADTLRPKLTLTRQIVDFLDAAQCLIK